MLHYTRSRLNSTADLCFAAPVPLTCLSFTSPFRPRATCARQAAQRTGRIETARPRRLPIQCATSEKSKFWARVRSAVPLSRAFADHVGQEALHQLNEPHKFKVVCPFHNDKNPSLHINDALGSFHCFGCGAQGSILDFEQLIGGHRSLPTAVKSLCAKYPPIASIVGASGYIPSTNSTTASAASDGDDSVLMSSPPPSPPRIPHRVRLTRVAIAREVLRAADLVFQRVLWDVDTASGLTYLTDTRGLSVPTLRAFGCGFAPPHPTSDYLLAALRELGHPADHVVQAGLARTVRTTDAGKSPVYYDVFRNRVMTPLRDDAGRPISFAGRVLPGGNPREPKYINGPESAVFRKQNVLFGADLAKRAPTACAENGYLVVLEGYLDVMSLFDRTQGRVACVASMGAAVSASQIRLAYGLLNDEVDGRVILNLDNDNAGIASLERLCDSVIPQLDDCAHAVFIAVPPPGVKDVDEFLAGSGKADEYVRYLLKAAKPWYQWQGDRVVQDELARLEAADPVEVDISNTLAGKEMPVSQPPDDLVIAHPEDIQIDFALADYLKEQADDMLVAFGAPPSILDKKEAEVKSTVPARCSSDVLDRLAEILTTAHRCLPGLNVSALVHSWADSLSRCQPKELLPLYQQLLARAEKQSRPWQHLTAQGQVYWMPPAPWVIDELPESKRKLVNDAVGYKADGDPMDIDTFMSDPKRKKRSFAKMDYQAAKIIPLLQARESDQIKRLKIAPRRCAEEIVLRALIFASEADRLDGLLAVSEVINHCREKGLPFWTSEGREMVYLHLSEGLDGELTPEEMAAYLEEHDWFTEDIEEIFEPLDEEAHEEWKAIRMLELKHPVAIATATARTVEVMAGKVASRLALEDSGKLMERMVQLHDAGEADSPESEKAHLEEVQKLVEKQAALQSEIDRTRFLTAKERLNREDELEEEAERMRDLHDRQELIRKLDGDEDIPPPDWILQNDKLRKGKSG